jgi:hypothetical protein
MAQSHNGEPAASYTDATVSIAGGSAAFKESESLQSVSAAEGRFAATIAMEPIGLTRISSSVMP